jgi:osmotically inducible protein OsmC
MGIGHDIDRVRVAVVTTSSAYHTGFHRPVESLQQEYIMNRPEKVIYTAKVHTTGGRVGSSRSDDGKLEVKLSRPGTSGEGTNPEQLFAAGWSACYQSAMELVARRMKLVLPAGFAVDAEVDLGPNGDGFDVAVRLNVSLPGIAPDVAQHLIETTHQVCPYSRATHGNIAVETKLV